jgi:hypothetical protein
MTSYLLTSYGVPLHSTNNISKTRRLYQLFNVAQTQHPLHIVLLLTDTAPYQEPRVPTAPHQRSRPSIAPALSPSSIHTTAKAAPKMTLPRSALLRLAVDLTSAL